MSGIISDGAINEHGICFLLRNKKVPITYVGVVNILCAIMILTQCVTMLRNQSTFTNMSEIQKLFKRMILSNILLHSFTLMVFAENALFAFQDWKSVYFTVIVVWNTANTLWVIGYMIYTQKNSHKKARSLFTGSEGRSNFSASISGPGTSKW
jgi:FlaA1/EpsC-like NDP-sugar epimerase